MVLRISFTSAIKLRDMVSQTIGVERESVVTTIHPPRVIDTGFLCAGIFSETTSSSHSKPINESTSQSRCTATYRLHVSVTNTLIHTPQNTET